MSGLKIYCIIMFLATLSRFDTEYTEIATLGVLFCMKWRAMWSNG